MRSLFSARELADLTGLDESAMPDTVTITTITIGTDLGGAQTQTESTVSSPGRLRKRSGREIAGDQLKERGDYELILPRDAVISSTSRVAVGGQPFRVVWCPVLVRYDTGRVVGLTEA